MDKKTTTKDKSLESWIWDAACPIRVAKDTPKYKDYIPPLIFTKRLCDALDNEINRIAKVNALLNGIIDRLDFNALVKVPSLLAQFNGTFTNGGNA